MLSVFRPTRESSSVASQSGLVDSRPVLALEIFQTSL